MSERRVSREYCRTYTSCFAQVLRVSHQNLSPIMRYVGFWVKNLNGADEFAGVGGRRTHPHGAGEV